MGEEFSLLAAPASSVSFHLGVCFLFPKFHLKERSPTRLLPREASTPSATSQTVCPGLFVADRSPQTKAGVFKDGMSSNESLG